MVLQLFKKYSPNLHWEVGFVSYAGIWVTAADQAAVCDAASALSTPLTNLTPLMTLGN
jgi:hypothetical protein